MTTTRGKKKPATTKEVGQLRFAAVDAFLPLSCAVFVVLVAGLTQVAYVAGAAGAAVALFRLAAYVGK